MGVGGACMCALFSTLALAMGNCLTYQKYFLASMEPDDI